MELVMEVNKDERGVCPLTFQLGDHGLVFALEFAQVLGLLLLLGQVGAHVGHPLLQELPLLQTTSRGCE